MKRIESKSKKASADGIKILVSDKNGNVPEISTDELPIPGETLASVIIMVVLEKYPEGKVRAETAQRAFISKVCSIGPLIELPFTNYKDLFF